MAKPTSTNFSLKDQLFNEERVKFLALQFKNADPSFDSKSFVKEVMKSLPSRELKQRIVLIAETLESYLSQDFSVAAEQILAALPPELDPTLSDDDFGDFIIAPLGEFVVRNGLDVKHLKLSLRVLKEITKRFSMEDSIRAFINTHPESTLKELKKWARDTNYHVRRLVSEGTRPRLPWSRRLAIDSAEPLAFLELLHADPTRYVTRSVANHLNDITKNEPQLVLKRLKSWQTLGQQDPKELAWISRHALRTLIKQGDAETMRFLGMRSEPKVVVSPIQMNRSQLQPGEPIEFEVTVVAERDETLIVDYVIEFVKANGTHSPKVFKAKQLSLKKGESALIRKRHPLRVDATTYRLFSGTHHLTIQVNGNATSRCSFELL